MKLFCVGRNYRDHAKEMNSPIPSEPVIFIKPHTAICKKDIPIAIPSFTQELHYECEIIFRICKSNKNINQENARQYIDAWTVGIDFTARDIQEKLKAKGLPWEIAKAFDGAAYIGEWQPISAGDNLQNASLVLKKNNEIVQQGNTHDMIFSIEKIIQYISQYFTLEEGDCIFTGTPAGVGPVRPNDKLQGFLNNQKLFEVSIVL